TVVRRVGHQEVNRATGAYIAKVVQGALVGCVARCEMPTSGAGGLLIVTAIKSQLGCWEVLDVDNALGGVWHVFTRSKHGWLPWKKGWDRSIKVITCPVYIESRIPATVSVFTCLSQYLAPTTLRQLHRVTEAMLSMTGRVTMKGLSRWTDQGGSYRTVQRFFNTSISW